MHVKPVVDANECESDSFVLLLNAGLPGAVRKKSTVWRNCTSNLHA